MAGIGPIDTNRRALLHRAAKPSQIASLNSDLEIFCFLCVGRVVYRKQIERLYFVDSPALSVTDIITKVYNGMCQQPKIEQQYMDVHSYIKAAYCITLTATQKKPLMVALRLSGIQVKTL